MHSLRNENNDSPGQRDLLPGCFLQKKKDCPSLWPAEQSSFYLYIST